MNRDLKRSLQRKQHHQQQQTTRAPLAMDFQQTIERQRLKKAMDYGITMGWMASMDAFNETLKGTKGIGKKRTEAILTQLEAIYQNIKNNMNKK